MSLTIERSFHLGNQAGRTGGYRRVVREGPEPDAPPPAPDTGRIPRVAKLMALAIRCDQLLRSGAVPDASALARLAHVSQPRMTQILNLTLLAPDIQEELLCQPAVAAGKSDLHEKVLRTLCSVVLWSRQRAMWTTMTRDAEPPPDGQPFRIRRRGPTPLCGAAALVLAALRRPEKRH